MSTALTSADFDEDGMLGLVIGEINRADGLADAAVAVSGLESPRVLVFQWSEGAFGNAER